MGTFVKGIVISLNVRNCESARFKIQSREDQRGQDIRDIMESYSHMLPSILSEVPTYAILHHTTVERSCKRKYQERVLVALRYTPHSEV